MTALKVAVLMVLAAALALGVIVAAHHLDTHTRPCVTDPYLVHNGCP